MILNIVFLAKAKGKSLDPEKEIFMYFLVPVGIMAIYGLVITLMLSMLSCYHFALVRSNETTQEEMRDKYAKWGGNPYNKGTGSKQNWNYFWIQQESLIYGDNKEPLKN